MTLKCGFLNSSTNYCYLEDSNNASSAIGLDAADGDALKFVASAAPDVVPSSLFMRWIMTTSGNRLIPLQPAFRAQIPQTSNITGQGENYWIGSAVALTEEFDQGGDFFVGDGAGTGARFTAPVDGIYAIGIDPYLFQDATGGVDSTVRIVTTPRTFIITTNPTDNRYTSFSRNWFSGTVIVNLTAGDTVDFYYQENGGIATSSSIFDGYVFGWLIC